jgi:hypothetical protein
LRNVLAVAQIALAVALVIGAALMCKGMLGMLHLADAYHPSKTLTFDRICRRRATIRRKTGGVVQPESGQTARAARRREPPK